MRVRKYGLLGALTLGFALSLATVAKADCPGDPRPCDGAGCPPSSYSSCHYWTPTVYRWRAYHHIPGPYLYAADRYPEMPPTYQFIKYPCRAVEPAAYYGNTNSTDTSKNTDTSATQPGQAATSNDQGR